MTEFFGVAYEWVSWHYWVGFGVYLLSFLFQTRRLPSRIRFPLLVIPIFIAVVIYFSMGVAIANLEGLI